MALSSVPQVMRDVIATSKAGIDQWTVVFQRLSSWLALAAPKHFRQRRDPVVGGAQHMGKLVFTQDP
jgi:hypothetical protein